MTADSMQSPPRSRSSRNPRTSWTSLPSARKPGLRHRFVRSAAQDVVKMISQSRNFQNLAQEQNAFARLWIIGNRQKSAAEFRITAKILRRRVQPGVHLGVLDAQVRTQVRLESFRVVHQESGVHLEKSRQQFARAMGHVRPRAAFNLRQVRLTDRFPQLPLHLSHHFRLGHGASNSAQAAFNRSQVSNFLAQCHIAICKYDIANCYSMSIEIYIL